MCTLLTLDRETFDADQPLWTRRILADAASNPHGLALLVAKDDGTYSQVRAQDPDLVVGVLAVSEWSRFWLHSRWGTGGANSLENTHGFCANGVWYMHNGFIRQAPAASMPVDSMAIGKWISDYTVYDKLRNETYANVFMVSPTRGAWDMIRAGTGGSLYTDGQENFATVATGAVSQPVAAGTTLHFHAPKTQPELWGYRRWSPPARLPAPRQLPAELGADTPRVWASASEYWMSVNAGETEFDMDTYRKIAKEAGDEVVLARRSPR